MSKKNKTTETPETEVVKEEAKPETAESQPEETVSIETLAEEVEKLKQDLAKAKNDYYKAYADADNLKKRLLNEAEQANKYRIQNFALSILPSIDSLERALDGKDVSDPFIKGVKLTYDSLMHALQMEGVTEIECLNKPFDANYANALLTEKVEGTEPNMVIEVLQKGYMLKDRLLRAALVKVSE